MTTTESFSYYSLFHCRFSVFVYLQYLSGVLHAGTALI